MARLPTVAIIGRPNTGKSTLFNRLAGKHRAIVSEVPGTTRDHVAHRMEGDAVDYLLLDTGGIGGGTEDRDFEADVERQSLLALEHADLILFTLESTSELTRSDFAVIDKLRRKRRRHVPVILVLTKCDNPARTEEILPAYYELGIADAIIPVSAIHHLGTDELEEEIVRRLTALHFGKLPSEAPGEAPRVAIIGKPNVGKSSLVNAFMSEPQRRTSPLLVSEIPGTTRDAVDTLIRYQGSEYIFIDTAGLKRRKSTEEGIETFAAFRTIRAVEECDIAVLLLEAGEPVSRQDKRIAAMAIEEGKGLVLLVNKIDLLRGKAREEKVAEIQASFPFCRYASVLPCSAKTRENLLNLFPLLDMIQRNRVRRIPTKELHHWFEHAVGGKPLSGVMRTKHITQARDVPPTFVLFVRDPKHVKTSELRALEKSLRLTFGFEGTPVRWITKTG